MAIPVPRPDQAAARHQYLGARTPRRVDTTHPALWWDFAAPSTQVVVVKESLSENTITSFREMRQRKICIVLHRSADCKSPDKKMLGGRGEATPRTCRRRPLRRSQGSRTLAARGYLP